MRVLTFGPLSTRWVPRTDYRIRRAIGQLLPSRGNDAENPCQAFVTVDRPDTLACPEENSILPVGGRLPFGMSSAAGWQTRVTASKEQRDRGQRAARRSVGRGSGPAPSTLRIAGYEAPSDVRFGAGLDLEP